MNARETLNKMYNEFTAELAAVREQYNTLAMAQQLMRRHGLTNAEDAFSEEAKQRLRRNQWAKTTNTSENPAGA